MTKQTIVIDAGHGGSDPGAVYQGRREKDDTLRLALAVGNILESNGFPVEFTRTTDITQSPIEKAAIANNSGADFFVSIHRNAMPIPGSASGVETLVYNDSGVKAQMARNINSELENLGFQNLGVQVRPNLIVLRRTQMPAVLVEAGFLDSPADNQKFDQQFNQIANAIADGIMQTLEKPAAPPKEQFYRVQVGLYRNRSNAEALLNRLESQGYPAFLVYDDGFYKVEVGAFRQMDNAVRMEQRLRNDGYATLLILE